jgi:hypothetical protein
MGVVLFSVNGISDRKGGSPAPGPRVDDAGEVFLAHIVADWF